MRGILAAAIFAFVLVIDRAATGSVQEDSFLTAYYADNESVLCRDYQTANGARVATYQWWLLGFVSGVSHERSTSKRPLVRVDGARVIALAEEHCRAKPTDTLVSAAIAIVNTLSAQESRK